MMGEKGPTPAASAKGVYEGNARGGFAPSQKIRWPRKEGPCRPSPHAPLGGCPEEDENRKRLKE